MKTVSAHLKHIVGNYTRAAVLGTAVITSAFLVPSAAHAQVFFSVNVAPPVIPTYEQPPCPGEGYIWTPGYWAYGDDGYYWVDGAWVEAPYEGALWTPGYWGFNNGAYLWNAGYWGNTVGYYGGIDYGFGYFGSGFYGGRWDRGHFFYNTAYNHIDGRRFHNIYDDRSHGGGTFVHPGGRAFDPHPRMDEHRGGGFNNNGFNQANRGNFNQQQNRGNFDQNRGNFNQNRGNFDQNRGGFNQGIRNNDVRNNDARNNDNRGFMSQPQQQPRTNFEQPGRGAYNQDRGSFNQQPGNRPVYQGGDNQQRNIAPPQTQQYRQAYNGGNQNPGRSFEAPRQGFNQPQQQPRGTMQAPPMQQQHFSQPAPQQARPPQSFSAPQQQHFSAPANNGGGGFHGGGGGEFHGGGRR